MDTNNEFLRQFTFGGLMAIATDKPSAPFTKYHTPEQVASLIIPEGTDVYFGPAMRSGPGDKKEDVLGSTALWVDVDDPQKPQCTLPPSMMVFSGHGWHCYWLLDTPVLGIEAIETLNKIMIEDVKTADNACWNANRVLRVPGTLNKKEEVHVVVRLEIYQPGRRYSQDAVRVLSSLGPKTRHKIRTGDSRGYRSRSERDWAIIVDLVRCGASDDLIRSIFDGSACGDKASENDAYLGQTIEQVRAKAPSVVAVADASGVEESEDGYIIQTKRGIKRLSTFTIAPTVLLDGSKFGAEDAIVGDVRAAGYTWPGITFSRSAFTSVNKFDKEAPVAAWQWLAHDDDLRALLPYLLDQLRAAGLPKVGATSVLGLHKIHDAWLFLGNRHVLSAKEVWEGHAGPVCWLPVQKEHPDLFLGVDCSKSELKTVRDLVPKLNAEATIWPMIGWYAASCLKPWLEEHHYRFPILNVAGTKGSGKTTLIQRVFLPLLGQVDPKTYDAGTTRFVTLALLGSSNAVPIAFSEFRYELVERLLRIVLLAYDTGHDPRGRGDQTTVDYPLSAPFSVDGEDLIEDPAARERLVVAHLHPKAIAEGSEGYVAFQSLREKMPPNFGGYYIKAVLGLEPEWQQILDDARAAVFSEYPTKLPDRVRANHVVAYFGMMLWCRITGTTLPTPKVLEESISSVFNIKSGRAATLADAMVEDIVNAIAQGTGNFNVVLRGEDNSLWFQLAPAHSWWVSSRRRQGRGALERDAIRAQLKEAPYSVPPQVLNDAWMYGINLQQAADAGLDVPVKIPDRVFVLRF
jgi:hypothetical protein